MADEEKKNRHHLFHSHKDGDEEAGTSEVDYEKKQKHHKHLEQLGSLDAIATGAYTIHEKHKAKEDPGNAHGHKVKEDMEVAAVAALGAAGFAFHEHHQKMDAKKLGESY